MSSMAPSPTIAIPKKTTDDVDWTSPIRSLIAQSYGESPENYAAECAMLQRCRQDAVRGAGSELTGRDLLYKYFGQLELLELRFAEIRVTFPWRDAFTNKPTTQTSLAFEKASIIFQIAATHSTIASTQNRSDPEGLKRAFYYFRTAAGMLTYINENFLHAPSTDLSRDVVKFLVDIMIAQAHEVFYEKCRDEKKTSALVSKVAAQTASLYISLVDAVKEFQGKKIFDHNWVTLLQIKAKYLLSLSQYHRSLADSAVNKHGDALVRLQVAEKLAKEAHTITSTSFTPYFVVTTTPTLPPDAGTALLDLTKSHLALCTEARTTAQRDNDLIYNAVLPSEAVLPPIDKTNVATPIPIQEVYSTPDVQKTIGPDLFARLVPLSVHEAASVYSEEKAKLVRAEAEKCEVAEGDVRAALESLGVKEGLGRFRAMVEASGGDLGDIVPQEVRQWQIDIRSLESSGRDSLPAMFGMLDKLKASVKEELDLISRDLDAETRECETGRVKYEHLWSQEPSAGLTRQFRSELKGHTSTLEAADTSDRQAWEMWESVREEVGILLAEDGRLGEEFEKAVRGDNGEGESLLDVGDVGGHEETEGKEREKIGGFVAEIEERLGRLNKISRERKETLKDLKEKIQSDDVSHLLLLNRRNPSSSSQSPEPALFSQELEKFKPYQHRIASTISFQLSTIQEIGNLFKALKDFAGRGASSRKWEERERKKSALVKKFARTREVWGNVREGVGKGVKFYKDLGELTGHLRREVRSFVEKRKVEREGLIARIETEKRLSSNANNSKASSPPPPPRPAPPSTARSSLETSFTGMSLHGPTSHPTSNASPSSWNRPQSVQYSNSTPAYPPPTPSHPPYNPGLSYLPPAPTAPSPFSPPPLHSQSPYSPPPPSQPQSQSPYSSSTSYGGFYSTSSAPPPPPKAPSIDPYMGMFNSTGISREFSTDSTPSRPMAGNDGVYRSTTAGGYASAPPAQTHTQAQSGYVPPPPPPSQNSGYGSPAPGPYPSPPPPQRQGTFPPSLPQQYHAPQPQHQAYQSYRAPQQGYTPSPQPQQSGYGSPQPSQGGYGSSQPQQQPSYRSQPPQQGYGQPGLPPPPPPVSYQGQYGGPGWK